MKKILFLFAMLLTCMSVRAQIFTPPTGGAYKEHAVNVKLVVNGTTINSQTWRQVEIAAFINDECRDVISSQIQTTYQRFNGQTNFFMMRVGGTDEEIGKAISFKVVIGGIVYKMKSTLAYQGEGATTMGFELNLDKITGVTLPESIKITQNLGTTYDLSKHIGYKYADGYTPKGESSVDEDLTKLVYVWEYENSKDYFTVEDNTLTTVAECTDRYLGLEVKVPADVAMLSIGTAFTNVTIEVPKVPVTEIKTKADSYECWNGDNLGNLLANEITVLPENASDKSVEFVQKSGPQGGLNAKGTFEKAGTYTITIKSVSTPEITKDITVVVKQHVESITCTLATPAVTVNVGENVFDAIKSVITVLPENATNKNVLFNVSMTGYIDRNGVAQKKSPERGGLSVKVVSEDNSNAYIEFTVKILDPVTAIRISPAEISVFEGDNVYDYITKNVTVTAIYAKSSSATSDYNAVPSETDAQYFTNNIANKAGSYTWVVSSTENANIKTNLTVTVMEPVVLSCDDYAELTIFSPGQVNIKVEKGKDIFDPKLVTVEAQPDVVLANVSSDGLTITFTGLKVASSYFKIFYDGKDQYKECNLTVGGEIKLENGWNWTSNYMDTDIQLMAEDGSKYLDEYFAGTNKVLEVRSQDGLLFNDPTYGVFGQITKLEPGTMYKMKANGPLSIKSMSSLVKEKPTVYLKGYTWIAYPIIGNHSFDYFNQKQLLANADDGDMIIGKNGFATFDITKGWVAQSGFKLETGKGYIYYQEEESQKSLDFGDSYVEEQAPAGVKAMGPRVNVWHFDANAFPETMCIVTRINGIEASDKYSVGAFVDDECRGMGTFVSDDVMFISVAGKSGETVSFRLYNAETEEYTEIPETMKYTMMKGSLKNPVYLSANEATGIQTLSEPTANGQQPTFNLAGQAVGGDYKGVVIKNGKKYLNK